MNTFFDYITVFVVSRLSYTLDRNSSTESQSELRRDNSYYSSIQPQWNRIHYINADEALISRIGTEL